MGVAAVESVRKANSQKILKFCGNIGTLVKAPLIGDRPREVLWLGQYCRTIGT
jgi:hypothetical protein